MKFRLTKTSFYQLCMSAIATMISASVTLEIDLIYICREQINPQE